MSPSPHPELLGAILTEDTAGFRVWAPDARCIDVIFQDGDRKSFALNPDADGYFRGTNRTASWLYKYRVDNTGPWPDPCSRFQPQGVHGPSLLLDPSAFRWTDQHVGAYGGLGAFEPVADYGRGAWHIQAQCTVLLVATPRIIARRGADYVRGR